MTPTMNRITFLIAIALLTFMVGVAAVSLWVFLRQNSEQKQHIAMRPVITHNSHWEKEFGVKWFFINEPFKWGENEIPRRRGGWGFITIFYENGEWVRVHVLLDEVSDDVLRYFDIKDKENKFVDEKGNIRNKIEIGHKGDYGIEAGNWKVENGEIKVTIIRCKCLRCEVSAPVDGYTKEELKNPLPIVESWVFKTDINNKKESLIQSPLELNRRMSREEFFDKEDIEMLVSASSFWMKKELNGLGEPCSKHYVYKNRFITKSK